MRGCMCALGCRLSRLRLVCHVPTLIRDSMFPRTKDHDDDYDGRTDELTELMIGHRDLK